MRSKGDILCAYWKLMPKYRESEFKCPKVSYALHSIRINNRWFYDTDENRLLLAIEEGAELKDEVNCSNSCEYCRSIIKDLQS